MSNKLGNLAGASDEIMKQAEAYAKKQVSTAKRDEQMRKNKFIKYGSLLLLTVIILVFATIAWFSMNRETTTSGMNVRSSTLPFELASTGAAPEEYIRLFNMADNEYDNGTKQGDTSEYRTGEYGQIFWRLDTESNDTYVNGFKPGAAGELSFDIIPKDSNALTVNCQFSIRGFVGTYNETTNALESMTEITSNSPAGATKDAFYYLNGHIVFFEEKNTVNGKDVYSGFIGENGLNVLVPEGGAKKSVTVYWKWVNTFDQMILLSTDNPSDDPLVADSGTKPEKDRTALLNYIHTNTDKIFSGLSAANATAATTVTRTSEASLLTALNDGYNTADQVIGVNLDYFLLELAATPGTASAEE